MKAWLKYLFILIIFGVPLLFYPAYDGWNLPKITLFYALTIMISALWLVSQLRTGKVTLKANPLFIYAFLWVLANLLSTIFSMNPPQSFWGQYEFYSYGLLPLVTAFIFSFLVVQMDINKNIFNWVVFGAVSSAVYGFMFRGQDGRFDATFGSPIYFSVYLAGAAPVALARFFEGRNRPVWFVSIIIIAAGLFMAVSRGAWIATGVSVIIFLLTALIRKQLKIKQVLEALGCAAVLGGCLVFSSTNLNKLKNTFDVEESSNFSRYEGWKASIGIIKENPFLGAGPANFSLAFRRHKTLEYVRSAGAGFAQGHAHNDFIQAAATTGLVGLGVYVLFWATLFSRAVKNTKQSLLETGILAGLAAIFIFNQFNNGMVPQLMLFWLMAGWVGRSAVDIKTFELKVPIGKPAVWAVEIIAVLLIYLCVIPFRAEMKVMECNSAVVSGDMKQAFKDLEEAINIHPGVQEYYKMMLDLGYAMAAKITDISGRKALLDKVQSYAEKNAEINRYNSDAHYNLGVVYVWKYELAGEDLREKAEKAFNESLKLDKYFVNGLTGLAKVYYMYGKPALGNEYFKQILAIEPGNAEALRHVKSVK